MDNTQQPDPSAQPQSMAPYLPAKNKLEELPLDARIELDSFLKRNLTINKSKTLLEAKWLGKTDALPATYKTYQAYFEMHKDRLLAERKAEIEEAQKNANDFKELADMTDSIANGADVSFKKKYQDILDFIEDRIAFIQDQQTHGFASPQYETVMVQLAKAKKEVLEKMEEYKTEVDEKVHEADMAFIENYAYELLLEVYNVVNEVYGTDRFSEFKEKLKTRITQVAQRAQERFDKDFNERE